MSENFRQISTQFHASLNKQTRLEQGIFFTPKTARDILFEKLGELKPQRILEPSFGSGEFLLDAFQRFPTAHITGVEYNQELFDAAQPILPNTMSLHNADFIQWTDAKTYDLIIGNPPYFVMKTKEKFACMTGRPNIYILFLYKCLTQHLADDGTIAFIIPTSIYNCSYYQPMRDYIIANCSIQHVETLVKPGFFETGQETTLLVLRKRRPTIDVIPFVFRGKFISPHYKELDELTANTTTLGELGLGVKTGNIIWNQLEDKLADDGTLLIYSSNIANCRLTLNNLKTGRRKQYVAGIDKPTISGPVILTERGYGNTFKLNAVLVDLTDFYAENHVNVIYAKIPDAIQHMERVVSSLRNEMTLQFIKWFIGNGSISATDLETMIPIW